MKQSKENKYWGDVDFKLFDTATEHTCTCAFNVEWVSIYKRWRATRATSATCSIEKDAGAATAGKRERKKYFSDAEMVAYSFNFTAFTKLWLLILQLKELQTRQATLLTLQRDAEMRLAEAEEEVCWTH